MDKVTTKQNLQKIKEALNDNEFKNEFNKLFKEYIDVKNTDKNAHYYAILKLLQDKGGMDRAEAEEFFKSLRVKNARLIEDVQQIQQEQRRIDERWKKERINLIANPLDIKSFISVLVIAIDDIAKKFEKLQKQLQLQFSNNLIAKEKIAEIEKLLNESKETLENLDKNNDLLAINNVVKNLEKIAENTQSLVIENIAHNISNIELDMDKEKEIEKQKEEIEGQQGEKAEALAEKDDDVLVENEQKTEAKTLDEQLSDSLNAVLNSLNKDVDEKTLKFFVLSEYLHAYNNHDLKDVYKQFDDVFSKDEFKAIVIYNEALMNGDVEDVFDLAEEQGFSAVRIEEYARILTRNHDEYLELEQELDKELEFRDLVKEKEKELEIKQLQRKSKSIDIAI